MTLPPSGMRAGKNSNSEDNRIELSMHVVEGVQKGNASAAAKSMPHPITAMAIGS
jgi:hypothetical protein